MHSLDFRRFRGYTYCIFDKLKWYKRSKYDILDYILSIQYNIWHISKQYLYRTSQSPSNVIFKYLFDFFGTIDWS